MKKIFLVLIIILTNLGVQANPLDFDEIDNVNLQDFKLFDLSMNFASSATLEANKGASSLSADEIIANIHEAYFSDLIDIDGDGNIGNQDSQTAVLYQQAVRLEDLAPAAIEARINSEINIYFTQRTGAEIRDHITKLISENNFDIDGNSNTNSNDSSLINIVIQGADEATINSFKGASPLSSTEIKNNINELIFEDLLDIDGDRRTTNLDGHILNLYFLGANDAGLEPSNATSSLGSLVTEYQSFREGTALRSYLLNNIVNNLEYDVDESGVIDSSDATLILNLMHNLGDDSLLDNRSPNSEASVETIKNNIRQLYFSDKLDFDGSGVIDSRDGFSLVMALFGRSEAYFIRTNLDAIIEDQEGINLIEYKPLRTAREIALYLDELTGQNRLPILETVSNAINSLNLTGDLARAAEIIIIGDNLQVNETATTNAITNFFGQATNDLNRKYDLDQSGSINNGDLAPLSDAINLINEALVSASHTNVLNELLRARAASSSANLAINIAGLEDKLNKLLARVDADGNGEFTRLDILAQLLATQVARFSQNLDYDFNLDGRVDKKDYDTINSLYKSRVPGLAGQFKLED